NPRFPAAVGARSLTGGSQRDLLLSAFASVAPERVPAADCGMPGILLYTAPRPGKSPDVLFDLYTCGGGGQIHAPQYHGGGGNIPGGGLIGTPVEVIESRCPVRFESFTFEPDTGGAGKFRGAISIRRSWRFLRDGKVNMRNYHFEHVSYGSEGGQNGTRSRVF